MFFLLKVLLNILNNVVLLTVFFEEYNTEQTVCHNILLPFNVNDFNVKLTELYCSMLIYAVM